MQLPSTTQYYMETIPVEMNDIYFENGNQTFDVAYSLYNNTNVDPSAQSKDAVQVDASRMSEIFRETVTDAEGRVLATLNDPYEANQGRTVAIKNTGEATYRGTLLGELNGNNYFYNKLTNKWESFTAPETFEFDETDNTTYGLTNGTITTLHKTSVNTKTQGILKT